MLYILSMLSLVTRNCSATVREARSALLSDARCCLVHHHLWCSFLDFLFRFHDCGLVVAPEPDSLRKLTTRAVVNSCCGLLSTITLSNIPVCLSAATSRQRPLTPQGSGVRRYSGCRRKVALSPCDANPPALCSASAMFQLKTTFRRATSLLCAYPQISQRVCRPTRPAHPVVQLSLPLSCRCFHQSSLALSRHPSLDRHGVANHPQWNLASKDQDTMVFAALLPHSVSAKSSRRQDRAPHI